MKEMVEQEIAKLRQLKQEQQERLQNAEFHVRGAQISLHKIEGALEVCHGMLERLPATDNREEECEGHNLPPALAGRVGGNGQADVNEPLSEK